MAKKNLSPTVTLNTLESMIEYMLILSIKNLQDDKKTCWNIQKIILG